MGASSFERLWLQPTWRRVVIAVAICVAMVLLYEQIMIQASFPPTLKVRAQASGDRMMLAWVQPAAAGWDAGFRPGDQVLAADRRPVGTSDDPAGVASAQHLTVRTPSGEVLTASAPAADAAFKPARVSITLMALSFLAIGTLVFVLSSDMAAGRILLGLGLSTATMLIASLAGPATAPQWALALVGSSLVGFGAFVLLLFLVFPVNRLRSPGGQRLLWLVVLANTFLLGWYGWVLLLDVESYPLVQRAVGAVFAAEVLGAGALLWLALRGTSTARPESRRVLLLVGLGAGGALAPFVLLSMLPMGLGMGYLVAPEVSFTSFVLLPASLAAAVLSRQFPGIRQVLQRGLVGLLIWIALAASFALLLEALRSRFAGEGDSMGSVADSTLVIVALVAGAFHPAQSWLRRHLERRLFPDSYDLAGEIRTTTDRIAYMTEVDDIACDLLGQLVRVLGLSWAAIVLEGQAAGTIYHSLGECPPGLRDSMRAARDRAANDLGPLALGSEGWTVPLVANRESIGVLAIGPKLSGAEFVPEDAALVSYLVPLAATALQSALLIRQLESQVERLAQRERALGELSARLMTAQEEERKRVALDLHDDPLQRAVLLARRMAGSADSKGWVQEIEEIATSIRAICNGIRPPVLDDLGLAAGLEWLVNDVRARSDCEVTLRVDESVQPAVDRLGAGADVAIFRAAQEALGNCLKHAQASWIRVTLGSDGTCVSLKVKDDGVGHNGDDPDGARGTGLGILGMRERLRPWAGVVSVKQGPEGGTVVTAQIELNGDARDGAR